VMHCGSFTGAHKTAFFDDRSNIASSTCMNKNICQHQSLLSSFKWDQTTCNCSKPGKLEDSGRTFDANCHDDQKL
jgi:hypothetical protein